MLGHGLHSFLHFLLEFFKLHGLAGHGFGGLHEVDELAGFVVAGADARLERIRRPAGLAADQVAGLVSGDGEEPRAEAAARVELVGRLMHLQKCLLEDVLGSGAIAEETDEKVIQLTLIAEDENSKARFVAGAVFGDELFVGGLIGGGSADIDADGARGGRAVGIKIFPVASSMGSIGLLRGNTHLHAFRRPATVQMVNV